ncbi:hypothetical protein [Modestobacter sp. NPDC049651]|uniref:hypothetical protein n=1 Tax=unclassified Modestobacter TaxID=2643866 RepID=UPI0033C0A8EA
MTGTEQQVAERLQALAARAGDGDPAAVLAHVAAAERDRRRRAAGWTAGAVVAVLAVLAGVVVDGVTGDQPPAAVDDRGRPALYVLPPRGEVAADQEFRVRLAARSWTGHDAARDPRFTEPADRRVVYAADVPGRHRWAVVVGRVGGTWAYAWFAGPAGAAPGELELAAPVASLEPSAPLALMDVTASPAPLVLLGLPGDRADWSPGLDRAPDGRLVRSRTGLPVVDGVPTGAVPAPIAWNSGEVRLLRGGSATVVQLVTTGAPPGPEVVWGDHSPDPAVLAACLASLGIRMDLAPDGSVIRIVTGGDQLSSAEQAVRDAAEAHCQALATGGG